MKLSVSLSDEDVRFLDEYAKSLKMASRSAVIQRAVRLLRASGLAPAYADAWKEWEDGEDADAWESTIADGLGDRGK
jgi:Arc/MetJ-type ribon-helix-helix transcriptional regulator